MARDPKHDILFQPIKSGPRPCATGSTSAALHWRGSIAPVSRLRTLAETEAAGPASNTSTARSIRNRTIPTASRAHLDAALRNLRAMTDHIHSSTRWPCRALYGASHAPNMESRARRATQPVRLRVRDADYCKEMIWTI